MGRLPKGMAAPQWRPRRKPSRRFWGALLSVTGVLWALLSPSLGAALLPPETLKRWFHDLTTNPPSREERVVNEYVAIVKKATTWERAPEIFGPSVDYFRHHFAQLDPRRAHVFP